VSDLDAAKERLLAAAKEWDRWSDKRAANQIKTTADWHLYQRAEREWDAAKDAWWTANDMPPKAA